MSPLRAALRAMMRPLGFGGAPLGNMFAAIDDATAAATLDAAWHSGVRYYDTAPHYGAGLSEHRFGAFLRAQPRDAFVLSTKVGRLLTPDPACLAGPPPFSQGLPFAARYDYSADGARRSIEDSLQRLGLARIDLVYVHDIAEDAHGPGWQALLIEALSGAGRALTRLRDEGVIGGWGLGVNRIEACTAALDHSEPDLFLLAGRYSLLDTTALGTLFPACAARGVGVVIGGPYNSGLLAGGAHFDYADPAPQISRRRDALAALAAQFGVDLRAAALQFCAAHPVVVSVIPGAKSPERVRQNAALMQAPIDPGFWTALQQADLLAPGAPVPVDRSGVSARLDAYGTNGA